MCLDIGAYPDGKIHLTLGVVGEQIVTMFDQMVNVSIWDMKRGYSVRPTKEEVEPKSRQSAAKVDGIPKEAASAGGMAIELIKSHLKGFGIDDPPKEKKKAALTLVQKIEKQPPPIYDFALAQTTTGSARGSAGLQPGAKATTTEPCNPSGQDTLSSKVDEVRHRFSTTIIAPAHVLTHLCFQLPWLMCPLTLVFRSALRMRELGSFSTKD